MNWRLASPSSRTISWRRPAVTPSLSQNPSATNARKTETAIAGGIAAGREIGAGSDTGTGKETGAEARSAGGDQGVGTKGEGGSAVGARSTRGKGMTRSRTSGKRAGAVAEEAEEKTNCPCRKQTNCELSWDYHPSNKFDKIVIARILYIFQVNTTAPLLMEWIINKKKHFGKCIVPNNRVDVSDDFVVSDIMVEKKSTKAVMQEGNCLLNF